MWFATTRLRVVASEQLKNWKPAPENMPERLLAAICCLLCLSLWIVLGGMAQTLRSAEDPLDDYKLAVGLYNKSRWKLAAESFQAFIAKNPQHRKAENARYYLGLTLVNLEDYKQAREVLRLFLKDFPKSADAVQAMYWVGQCSYLLDDFAAAEKELATFAQKAPGDPLLERALPYLGDIELRLNKPEPALQYFQQALKAYPQGAMAEDAKFGAARSSELLQKYPDAIRLYQELAANKAGARAAEAQLNLGARYFDDGNFAASAEAYERLEKQFPESPYVSLSRLNQGFAQFQGGDFRKAIAHFDKVAVDPKFAADGVLWKGLSLKSLAEYPQAIVVFKDAYEKYKDQPQAEKLLYQWADCEHRQGAFDKARELFVEVVNRWPKGTLADESLYAACLAAVNGGKIPEADGLLARFDKDFPGNKLRFREEILKGRVLLSKNDAAGAAKQFQAVVTQSDLESTKTQARYYLTASLQKLGQHQQVLEASAPLIAQLEKDKSAGEYSSVYVLRAASALALGKSTPKEMSQPKLAHFTAAMEASQKYLAAVPKGDLVDQALAIKILATAHSGNKPGAQADLQTLKKQFPQSADLDKTLFELGEIAFANSDWEWAESLFGELASRPQESKFHARALSELGWAEFKHKKFPEAAVAFGRLVTEHPTDELAAEGAFMQGTALQDGGKLQEAQTVFAETFKKLGTHDQAFLSGLQSARLLAKLKRVPDADVAYGELLKQFPKHPKAALVLDEWATTNYEAENFARADEIFRRLVQEYPTSDLADNAQLSLAESDLVSGKTDAARTQFAALAKSPQSDPNVQQRALYQFIRIELELKHWDDLRKACQDDLERFPEGTYRWDVEFHWAEADFQLQAYKEAQERLLKLKAEKNNPVMKTAVWFPRVWVLLAETQFRLKQYADVAATVTEFRVWNAQAPLLYQADEVLGRSLKAQAKFPEARAAFERVVKDTAGQSTETAAKSQFHIAETYLLEKNYKKAVVEYLKVEIRFKYPEWQAPALFQAGVCHEALGEWKDAVQAYEGVLKDYPNTEFAPKAKEKLEVARKKAAG